MLRKQEALKTYKKMESRKFAKIDEKLFAEESNQQQF